jgi:hypothetical protein
MPISRALFADLLRTNDQVLSRVTMHTPVQRVVYKWKSPQVQMTCIWKYIPFSFLLLEYLGMPISRALFADLLRTNDQVLSRVTNAHCKNKIQSLAYSCPEGCI